MWKSTRKNNLEGIGEVITRSLCFQAWERAKGELYSMLDPYWRYTAKHEILKQNINEFVRKMDEILLPKE